MSGKHAAGKGDKPTVASQGGAPSAARTREQRGGRRAKPADRSRWLIWAAVMLLGTVVLLGVGTLLKGLGSSGSSAATPAPSSTEFDKQRTMLIQLRDSLKAAIDNSIVATGGGVGGASIMPPSQLWVDVAGAGQMPLSQSVRVVDAEASQDALSDLLALRIDATWTLERLAFSGLVDAVGGVDVEVTDNVINVDPKTGQQTVVVSPGKMHLDGSRAADYVLATNPAEPEAVRLARWSDVLGKTLAQLPDDAAKVQTILTSLGSSARTTLPSDQIARMLLRMRGDLISDNQEARVLPTLPLDVGSAQTMLRADLKRSGAMVTQLMPQAALAGEEARARILTQNGVGTPGLGAVARDRLVDAGFVYVNGGNASRFGRRITYVLIPDASAESRKLGMDVAKALKVPTSGVVVAPSGQNVAEAIVILGADFPAK